MAARRPDGVPCACAGRGCSGPYQGRADQRRHPKLGPDDDGQYRQCCGVAHRHAGPCFRRSGGKLDLCGRVAVEFHPASATQSRPQTEAANSLHAGRSSCNRLCACAGRSVGRRPGFPVCGRNAGYPARHRLPVHRHVMRRNICAGHSAGRGGCIRCAHRDRLSLCNRPSGNICGSPRGGIARRLYIRAAARDLIARHSACDARLQSCAR